MINDSIASLHTDNNLVSWNFRRVGLCSSKKVPVLQYLVIEI